MKKIILAFSIMTLFAVNLFAQTPQYYNSNTSGIGNSLPFGSLAASGYMTQWLIGPGEYTQPSPAPAGMITKFYIYMSTSGSGTYTQLTIKMGQTNITSFPSGMYTGQLDTVYLRASGSLSSTANTWMEFTLDKPFNYNPAQSLVIQVSHCGFTGGGMNIWQSTGTSGIYRRNNIPGTPQCVFTYSSQDTRVLQNGIDISAVSSINRALKLPTPGVNLHYVVIPHQSGMIGFSAITIEGWMKIGGFTTANTLLNKGASLFDYQLGITTGHFPFFRAGSQSQGATSMLLPEQTWFHLAATYDGTTIKFYLNGSLGYSAVNSNLVLGNSTNEMRIGRGGSDPGSGLIDEVRLWNVVRTEAQISADMCNKWVPNNSTGLKGKWHFDSTYTDSVNGWNGTPTTSSVTFDTTSWCPITGIVQNGTEIPVSYVLEQNYPNPFNPTTTIKFSLPKDGYVEMKLFDVTGKEVATLVSDPYRAGTYSVEFDASRLASGVYFYKMRPGSFTATKKMILIK